MSLSAPPSRLPQLTPPSRRPTVDDVKNEASAVWNSRNATKHLGAFLTAWTVETAEGGAPMVSARVLGQRAEEAMLAFANGLEPVTAGAEQRPQVDYSEPGVVACTWRRGGVWVRLWATDTARAPTPLVMPARVAPLPSGRLPHRRNTNTACGTSRDYTEEN